MKIIINTYNTSEVVRLDAILYAHSNDRLTLTTRDDSYAILDSLNLLEIKLRDHGFFRCHKSYLVNLEQVVRIINKQEIEISNGDKIPLARRKVSQFMNELDVFLKRNADLE